jgi:peptidase M23-like protein
MKFIATLPVLFAFLVGALPAHAWTWPVEGPVLRPFNLGSDPYAAGLHRGIDIAAQPGAAVQAPAPGLVSFAGNVPRNGQTLTISTADGYAVTLVHLGSLAVARGATVGEGATVGTIGPSGEAEHAEGYVHLGVRVAAEPEGYIDPLTLLPARSGGVSEPSSESGTQEPDRAPPVEIADSEPAPEPVATGEGEAASVPSSDASEPSPSPPQPDEAPAEPATQAPAADVPADAAPQTGVPVGAGEVEVGVPIGAPQAESGLPADEQPAEAWPATGGDPAETGLPADSHQADPGLPTGEHQVDTGLPAGEQQAEIAPPVEAPAAETAPPPIEDQLEPGQPAEDQPAEIAPPADESEAGLPAGEPQAPAEDTPNAVTQAPESAEELGSPAPHHLLAEADGFGAPATQRVGVSPKVNASPVESGRGGAERFVQSSPRGLTVGAALPTAAGGAILPTPPQRQEGGSGWTQAAWPAAAAGALVLLLMAFGLRRRQGRIDTVPRDLPPEAPIAGGVQAERLDDESQQIGPTPLDAWLEALLSSQPRCAAAAPPRWGRAERAARCGNAVHRPLAPPRPPRRSQVRERARKEAVLRP